MTPRNRPCASRQIRSAAGLGRCWDVSQMIAEKAAIGAPTVQPAECGGRAGRPADRVAIADCSRMSDHAARDDRGPSLCRHLNMKGHYRRTSGIAPPHRAKGQCERRTALRSSAYMLIDLSDKMMLLSQRAAVKYHKPMNCPGSRIRQRRGADDAGKRQRKTICTERTDRCVPSHIRLGLRAGALRTGSPSRRTRQFL
ncbi:hypothetical protein SAMN02745157_3860 [Kaistia soli DSM 19436]|uniref:Uncharacterized protein n=1 Tax=Kaistia soli DSM 19436 TaxID=1122133 RepID=A0A1M5IE62_9HYPH|nr:hypothetical protein SAMN02745157_3860 [Kaistia soli DSM 19436]